MQETAKGLSTYQKHTALAKAKEVKQYSLWQICIYILKYTETKDGKPLCVRTGASSQTEMTYFVSVELVDTRACIDTNIFAN